MARVLATPGVYIDEKSAFPNSAVPVPTAVPVFIGYTEKAIMGKKSLLKVPTKISSYGEFLEFFGGPPKVKYTIEADAAVGYKLTADKSTQFILHSCMKLFFSNGGSDCYIVSVGKYTDAPTGVVGADLTSGIEPLLKEPEPTMVVIPEAILLVEESTAKGPDPNDNTKQIDIVTRDAQGAFDLQVAMLAHCGLDMRNRVAILDVPLGNLDLREDVVKNFRVGIGQNFLQWGGAYYPFLETTIVAAEELDFSNIVNITGDDITADAPDFADKLDDKQKLIAAANKAAFDTDTTAIEVSSLATLLYKNLREELSESLISGKRAVEIHEQIVKLDTFKTGIPDAKADEATQLHQTLLAVSPTYKELMKNLRSSMNLLPPSPAMAGIYSMVDNTVGVHQSPANISVGSVIKPAVDLTAKDQEDLNLPLNGNAINAIRTFPGKGVLVWGARTLDGNSQDWRYISVRRTVIFIEQSIKFAAEAYVFEPNVSSTWSNIRALISNFLTNVWKSGALAGATPDDAFSVDVGLGTTMTPIDILDGIMRISVRIAVTRPAEFIVITFQQKMQTS